MKQAPKGYRIKKRKDGTFYLYRDGEFLGEFDSRPDARASARKDVYERWKQHQIKTYPGRKELFDRLTQSNPNK